MLKFNVSGLESSVKPALNSAKSSLRSARGILSSITVPSGFSEGSQARALASTISGIESELSSISASVGTVVSAFQAVEGKNENILNGLNLSISGTSLVKTNKQEKKGVKSFLSGLSSFLTGAKKTVTGAVNNFLSGNWMSDTKKAAQKTGAKIVKNVKSKVNELLKTETGAKLTSKVKSTVKTAKNLIKSTGSTIKSLVKSVTSSKAAKTVVSGIKKTAASVTNATLSVVKGLGQFAESLLDTAVIAGTGVATIGTSVVDLVNYVKDSDNFSSSTKKMWKETMAFVSNDYVDTAFKNFYQEDIVGKWLDENAINILKSDGIGSNVISGVGYVAGIVALSLLTAGIGGAAAGAGAGAGTSAASALTSTSANVVRAGIATAAGFGKYTAEQWAKERTNNWEYIQQMYEKGDISEQQYNSYLMIRSMNYKEWQGVIEDLVNGKITYEQYKLMDDIRSMPDDMVTMKNILGGIAYGAANALWEGIQWYAGGKLAEFAINGSKIATSAVRVGADTAFNAMDTPYRAVIDSLINNKDLSQAFKEQGGWKGIGIAAGIGAAGSIMGEVSLAKKVNLNEETSNITKSEINKLINKLNSQRGGNIPSDPKVIKFIEETFNNWSESNTPYSKQLLSKLTELKSKYPNLSFRISAQNNSYWNPTLKAMFLGNNVLDGEWSGVFAHETGHLLFDLVMSEKIPNNWDNVVSLSRVISSDKNGVKLKNAIDEIIKFENSNKNEANYILEQTLKSQGYNSISQYEEALTKYIENNFKNYGRNTTTNMLKQQGFSQRVIEMIENNNILQAKDISQAYIYNEIGKIAENLDRTKDGSVNAAISDIIGSVYEGSRYDLKGNYLNYTYSHPENYYKQNDKAAFHEIIANFTQLKLNGNNKGLETIKNVFGNEFYQKLEETFNKFLE